MIGYAYQKRESTDGVQRVQTIGLHHDKDPRTDSAAA